MTRCQHRPSKEIRDYYNAFYGERRVGRDENNDRKYEPILCKFCGIHIHAPTIFAKSHDYKKYGSGRWHPLKEKKDD